MRNFGNDSFTSHPLYHHPYPHHQLAHPPPHLPSSPHPLKMEPFSMTKTIGVGTNLKQTNKSHFSPVTILAPSAHNHHQNHVGSGGHNVINNSNNNNGIPINLSHHGHTMGTVVSSANASHHNHPSLLATPTAALAAACPITSSRGPSPAAAHHQQIPTNGLPYHPSHSPTLPIANTAVPSETHGVPIMPAAATSSSGSSQANSGGNSPNHYHHYTSNFTKAHPPHNNTSIDLTNSASSNQSPLYATANNSKSGGVTSTAPVSSSPSSRSGGETTTMTHPTSSNNDGNSSNPPMTNGTGSNNSGSNSSSSPTARIVSQNVNGTLAVTGIPTNESELQLFRVLQRANLLSYFDMMIELGGDDVQQLCEAGEAEFLEIMALIGMAAKPLHVRRLQKALQEWMTQPSLFQSPVLPPGYQHYGVSHVDRTVTHTQYTTTTIASSSPVTGAVPGGHQPSHPLPVIPIPHLISHNPISPYPAQSAPSYTMEPHNSSSDTSQVDPHKNVKLLEGRSNSPSSSNTPVGLQGAAYLPPQQHHQQGSPSIPVVISTNPSYTGQGQSSNLSSSELSNYQNCPSPSGSTSSRSSSTVSIRSHHHHSRFHPPSPMENSIGSPASSESGRSNKQEELSISSELENTSSSSTSSDQSNSTQTLDNSTGTTTTRVASRSGSGSEPSSPAQPASSTTAYNSFQGMIITQTPDSPRPSTESVTNRMIPSSNSNNSVTAATVQDFTSLQDHEIQKLAQTAMNLVRSLPPNVNEPKPFSKKIETSSYEFVLRLAEDDPQKMDEIRRLSAIFGRNSQGKRSKSSSGNLSTHVSSSSPYNNIKSVSILELAMNEAAAQLCKLVPALLTKRDEMFNLARQVIRESGLPYSVISANSNLPGSFMTGGSGTFGNNNSSNNSNDGVTTSSKHRMDELRNSPSSEERISHEFAAACKKLKLDTHGGETQEANGMQITEIRNLPPKKSVHKENKLVTATALKRMALLTSEFRRNCKPVST